MRLCSAVLLLLLLCCSLCSAQSDAEQQRIPRLIHRNYMAGAAALQAATVGPQPDFRAHWLASCTTQNPGWQEVIWDEAAVLKLIQEDFPWFLDTYLSYPRLVQRSDVMRYMALYKYGGVYLDADVECYTNMEQSLQGQELVLSCEEPGAWGQLHNAAMASTAGHPFWLAVLQDAMRRSPAAVAANSGWAQLQFWKLWRRMPFFNGLLDVLQTTGPILLTDMYRAHTGGAPACGYKLTVDGRVSTAYPVATWFTPCLCSDDECLRHWNVQHFKLIEQQEQGKATQLASNQLQKQIKLHQGRERRHQRQWQQQLLRHLSKQQQGLLTLQKLTPQQHLVVGIHQYSASWTGWDQSHKLQQQQKLKQEMSKHVLDYLATSSTFLQQASGSDAQPLASSSATQPPASSSATQPPASSSAAQPPASSSAAQPPTSSSADATAGAVDALLLQSVRKAIGSKADSPCSMLTILDAAVDTHNITGGGGGSVSSSANSSSSSSTTGCQGRLACALAADVQGVAGVEQQALDGAHARVAAHPDALQIEGAVQQLGCGSTVVTPNSWFHPPGTERSSSRPRDLWLTPPDLLQEASGNSSDARHIVRFSCSGCELPVLQKLFSLPWDSHSVLEQVRLLFIDLTFPDLACSSSSSSGGGAVSSSSSSGGGADSGSGVCAAPSSTVNVTGWDDIFNLLHQQLGFKGFWRERLDSGTVSLGWMRDPTPVHAKLQAPESSHAAEALRTAAAHTPRAVLTRGVCNCCTTCCSAGSSSCAVWRRMACMLGLAGRNKQCLAVTATSNGSSTSSGSGEGGCASGHCPLCCRCKPALWGLFQGQSHASMSTSDGSSTSVQHSHSGHTFGVLPVLSSWAIVVATVAVFQQAFKVNRVHRAAKLKQAKGQD